MKKKVVFLDRDGVINKKTAEHSYVLNLREFQFNDGIFEVLNFFKEKNFEFIIITNQRGISRRLMTEVELQAIHNYMKQSLEDKGVKILDIFYCPHGEGECACRKPKPGLLSMATNKYEIDLSESIYIGDSEGEIKMAEDFGIKNAIFVPHDKPELSLEKWLK